MMMIPEAYEDRDDLPEDLKGFYAFHSCLMEPWDGPAAVAFTDGRVIGATLDRNGLRPGRWLETKDGWVVLGSETGVMDEPAANVMRKGRLQPGKLFLVDLERGRIVDDDEVKREVAGAAAVRRVVRARASSTSPTCPTAPAAAAAARAAARRASSRSATRRRTCASCSRRPRPRPRSRSARWATTPRWPCSRDRQPPLFTYFKQLFAQVTNPPIDPIREAIVMSVGTGVGSERNLLDETPEHAHQLVDADADPVRPRARAAAPGRLARSSSAHTLDITWPVAEGPDGHGRARSSASARRPTRRSRDGVNILILSDRARRPRAGADPVAARRRRRAPPPRARGHAPADRPRARVRRAARGPPLRDADRLRRAARSTRT